VRELLVNVGDHPTQDESGEVYGALAYHRQFGPKQGKMHRPASCTTLYEMKLLLKEAVRPRNICLVTLCSVQAVLPLQSQALASFLAIKLTRISICANRSTFHGATIRRIPRYM
jgi:hypothetical protein